jgi:dTDP-4-amino-4,6-dideoxygalactose transaminase
MIPVTKPFSPPIEEYQEHLNGIWDRNWFTNNGVLSQELESKLKKYFDLEYLLFMSNGTITLQIAIKALGLSGEIITTPFSYVATTSSIVWENCEPVFVDIDPETLNIDPKNISSAITPNTSAILATHVFGNPCDIQAIDKIAKEHGLKVIYDAAHCFGTKFKGESVFKFGDVSTASFHATKIFHTIEGGAVFTNNFETFERMKLMRNFGHAGFDKFEGVGINGKNSEFHAAMGLCNLNYIDDILQKRKEQCEFYTNTLEFSTIRTIQIQQQGEWNYSYYPIIFNDEVSALKVKSALEDHQIIPRRYFYPSLDQLDYVSEANVPVSRAVANSVLCLPLYHTLTRSDQQKIADIVLENV